MGTPRSASQIRSPERSWFDPVLTLQFLSKCVWKVWKDLKLLAWGPGPLCQAWFNEARHNGGCNLRRQIVYLPHPGHGGGDVQTGYCLGPLFIFSLNKLLLLLHITEKVNSCNHGTKCA